MSTTVHKNSCANTSFAKESVTIAGSLWRTLNCDGLLPLEVLGGRPAAYIDPTLDSHVNYPYQLRET
jgi:hypothetical protein